MDDPTPTLDMVCEVSDEDSQCASDQESDTDELITEDVLIKCEEGLKSYILEPRKPGIEPSDELDYEEDLETLEVDESDELEIGDSSTNIDEDLAPRLGNADW